MRSSAVSLVISSLLVTAQTSAPLPDLRRALAGSWAGTLEYRDYSEPATSIKRVKLPTWLEIEAATELRFRYVYDDGPSKTVFEKEVVRIDPVAERYQVLGEDGNLKDEYAIAGLGSLREGRGTLTLSGKGTENGKPVDARATIRIGRNILEIIRETAPRGQPLAFRHAYTLVRTSPPDK
jgi:hypothetical protein